MVPALVMPKKPLAARVTIKLLLSATRGSALPKLALAAEIERGDVTENAAIPDDHLITRRERTGGAIVAADLQRANVADDAAVEGQDVVESGKFANGDSLACCSTRSQTEFEEGQYVIGGAIAKTRWPVAPLLLRTLLDRMTVLLFAPRPAAH